MSSMMLSGPFDTSELPKIGSDPVTVTVARRIAAGHEAVFEDWAERTVAEVKSFSGCLGAGLLKPGAPGGEYQLLFRFADAVHLRMWERSPEREVQLAEIAPIVESMRVTRSVGVDNFFSAPARAEIRRPVWAHLAIDVAWAFPVVATVSVLLGPRLVGLPFWASTAISISVVTTVMRLGVGRMRGLIRRRTRLD
jgi:antibiotic biosynthesis monooxygenase (ABM) superfamily enzyme